MTSVPAKDILQSAIAVGDWLLSCQKNRNKERYEKIFSKLYETFLESRADEDAYSSFVDALGDVFDILAEGKVKGHVYIYISSPDEGDERKVEKSIYELLSNAQDYLMFLLIFAKHLDSLNPQSQYSENHIIQVIHSIKNLVPRYYSEEEPAVDFPELRLRAMMSGFDFLAPQSVYRYEALCHIVDFARKQKLFEILLPFIHEFDDWIFNYHNLTTSQKLQLYLSVLEELQTSPRVENDLIIILKKIISLYDSDPVDLGPNELKAAENAAVKLLVLAISANHVMTFNEFVESRTIQKLNNSIHKPLYKLVTLFDSGTSAQVKQFLLENPKALSTYNLDENKCLEKIQVIVLASMPLTFDEKTKQYYISLDSVAKQLNISIQEAERLAVRATGLNAIDGRIDQLEGVIEIRSNLMRSFRHKEWLALQEKLDLLHRNTEEILDELNKQEKVK